MSSSITCDDVTVLRTYRMKARYEADGGYNPADWDAQLSLFEKKFFHGREEPQERPEEIRGTQPRGPPSSLHFLDSDHHRDRIPLRGTPPPPLPARLKNIQQQVTSNVLFSIFIFSKLKKSSEVIEPCTLPRSYRCTNIFWKSLVRIG